MSAYSRFFPWVQCAYIIKEGGNVIYCQLRERVTVPDTLPLELNRVADVTGMAGKCPRIVLPCPQKHGVWRVTALDVARALQAAFPQETLTLLGPEQCYVHRERVRQRDPLRPLRTAAAFAVLLFGSMLGLAWFHSDVDMPRAMEMLFTLIVGEAPADPRWITIPYIAGVALGVCVFYALPSKKAVTPLEVKLTEYQGDMEKTEARSIHGEK